MKKALLKSISIGVLYFVFAIFLEVVTFLTLGFGFFPEYSWFDIGILAIITGVIILIPTDIGRLIGSILMLTVQVVLAIVNNVMYSVCGDILTIEMIKLAGEGLSAFDMTLFNWGILVLFLVISVLILTVYYIVFRVPTPYVANKRKFSLYILLFFCLFEFGGYAWYTLSYSLLIDRTVSMDSDVVLFEDLKSRIDAYEKFGSFGYYFKNLKIVYFTDKTISDEKLTEYANFLNTNTETPITEYTGISEGNNVITILLETMDYIAIDPVFTPTLYQLFYEDCYSFTNYITENKTNVSEGLTLFGNYSIDYPATSGNQEIRDALGNNVVDYTLANIVKHQTTDVDTKTTYVHNNVGSYYSRDVVFPSAGYDELITLDKMNELKQTVASRENEEDVYPITDNFQDFTRDSDMFSIYIDDIAPTTGERFVTSISTISMHGPHKERATFKKYYNQLTSDQTKLDEMYSYLESQGYTIPDSGKILESYLWYKAAAMDVDKAFEILFNHLESNDLAENTTVLMFSDHNCYYESLSWHFRYLDRSESYVTDLYRQPCMIYDQKLCAKINNDQTYEKGYLDDRFVCPYNNLPTILDLLGLKYNPNFYMGCSIFHDDLKNQIFNTLKVSNSYMNDRIYMMHNEVKYKLDDVTQEELDTFIENRYTIYNKQEIVDAMYSNPKLFTILKSLQEQN